MYVFCTNVFLKNTELCTFSSETVWLFVSLLVLQYRVWCGSEEENAFVFAGLIISLQLLRGDMEQIRRENPMIFNRGLAITRKLGFPDVIMPGKQDFLGLGGGFGGWSPVLVSGAVEEPCGH